MATPSDCVACRGFVSPGGVCVTCGRGKTPEAEAPDEVAELLARLGAALARSGRVFTYKILPRYPNSRTDPRSRSDHLIDLLRAEPGCAIDKLARAVYGAQTEKEPVACGNRTRALLSQLARLGKLRNVSPGRWEVVPEAKK